ncbi:hypothetical protein B0H34DRAFT_43047 [Crassisporium funariophilum]|nr:hypothetical protein B0H34DRAFT_43047 [Crassisporium funariophilum]
MPHSFFGFSGCQDSIYSSPSSLPGAWASTWSLSPECLVENLPLAPGLSNDFQQSEDSDIALSGTAVDCRDCSLPLGIVDTSNDSSRSNESRTYEGHKDLDTCPDSNTVLPNQAPDGVADRSNNSTRISYVSDSSSSTHISSSPNGGKTLTCDASSSGRSAEQSSNHSDMSSPVFGSNDSLVGPSLDKARLNSPPVDQNPFIFGSIDRDQGSILSDLSVMDFPGVCQLVPQRDFNPSSPILAETCSSPPHSDRNSVHTPPSIIMDSLDIQSGSLLLSQPDGHAWTLSLDPTFSCPESVSRSSTSLSLSSYIDSRLEEIRGPSPSGLSSIYSTPLHDVNLSLPVQHIPGLDNAEKSSAHINASDTSVVASLTESVQQALRDRWHPDSATQNTAGASGQKTFDVHQRPPDQPLKIMQKTKDLVSRIKRFITSKGLKSRRPRGTKNDPHIDHLPMPSTTHPQRRRGVEVQRNEGAHASDLRNTDLQIIPPSRESTFRPSSPSWSSFRRRGGQRSARSITPAFAPSLHPEPFARRPELDLDEKNTYEYHARPKTLKEIKSRRRFTLPAAFGGCSLGPSGARNITTITPSQLRQNTSLARSDDNMSFNFSA